MASKKLDRRKRKELSPRQMKLIKARAEGKTYAQAAIEAGYPAKNAAQSGYQALSQIRGRVQDLLDKAGLDERTTIEKYLKPALEATETIYAQSKGKFTDKREVIAWGPRLTALKEAFLLQGSYAPRDPREAAQYGVKIIIADIQGPPGEVNIFKDMLPPGTKVHGPNGNRPPKE
jgi:hypothetical protein